MGTADAERHAAGRIGTRTGCGAAARRSHSASAAACRNTRQPHAPYVRCVSSVTPMSISVRRSAKPPWSRMYPTTSSRVATAMSWGVASVLLGCVVGVCEKREEREREREERGEEREERRARRGERECACFARVHARACSASHTARRPRTRRVCDSLPCPYGCGVGRLQRLQNSRHW